MARAVDSTTNSATSRSMCARSLLETWNRLIELTPPSEEADDLDDLARRREARRAWSAAASNT